MLIYIIWFVACFLLFRFIIKPFAQLLLIKFNFGRQAKLNFIPIFGYIWLLDKSYCKYNDHFEQIRRYFRENKELKFLLINMFHRPMIIIGDPEYNKIVYTDHNNFEKPDLLNTKERLLGEGLFFQSGNKWKQQRNLLGKPFDYDKLKSKIPLINQIVKEKIASNHYSNIPELTRSIAGEVIIQTFFGMNAKGFKLNNRDAQEEIVELFTDIAEIIFNTFYGFFKWQLLGELQWKILPNKAEKDINRRITLLHDFSATVILNRIKLIKQQGFKKNIDEFDFLDYHLKELMDEQNTSQITEREILSQFLTLFFGGTDTTSNLAAVCLFYLVKYPDTYDTLLKEIEMVVGDGDVQDFHLSKLKLIHSFVQEVLRQRNPATGPLIRIAKTDIMIKNLKVKKGWMVLPSNFVQQWNDKYFDNYEEFDPRRFLKQDPIKEDNGFVNVPFSAGPRNCIGQVLCELLYEHLAMMEVKIMLCHILRKYRIAEVPDKIKNQKWKSTFLYSYDPSDCIKLVQK